MWYAGIDWADKHHDAVAIDEAGKRVEAIRVMHDAAGLDRLVAFLRGIGDVAAHPESLACIIETNHGLLIAALLEAGLPVYPVNPKTVVHRRNPAGAKNDALDTYLLARTGRSDLADLRPLTPDTPLVAELKMLTRDQDTLIQAQTRLVNQLTACLKAYYPVALELFSKLHQPATLAFLRAYPTLLSCPNLACPDKGVSGAGNVRIHSRAEARYRCRTCKRTFAATTNTPLYRLHHPEATLMLVLTLLLHGCPSAAIVAAFGVDERTVRAWLHKAGAHAALLHDQLIGAAGVEARQVQADAIRVRVRGGVVWAAVALAVDSRFWLATAVARRRDGLLVHLLLRRALAALASRAVLLAVDGFGAYVTAARALVRVPERLGRPGRPRLVWPEGFALAQVIKAGLRRGEGIARRVAVGTAATVEAALAASRGGASITTAYIERLNATLRERLAPLVRRRRTPAHGAAVIEDGLHLLRLAYNWCWAHESLRLRAIGTGRRYLEPTPAMAAGLADRPYTLDEMLRLPALPVPLTAPAPRRRGRPPARGRLVPFPPPAAPPSRSAA